MYSVLWPDRYIRESRVAMEQNGEENRRLVKTFYTQHDDSRRNMLFDVTDWLPPIFEVQQLNGTIANFAQHNRKSEIQDGGR